MPQQVPVAEGLFTWPSESPQLIASEDDGVISFPARAGGSRRLLGRRGTLWGFTTQEFPPPSPPYDGPSGKDFTPFSIGYVDLPGELLVQARFTEPDPAKLRIGQEMELVVRPYRTDADGNDVVTFMFAPVPVTA